MHVSEHISTRQPFLVVLIAAATFASAHSVSAQSASALPAPGQWSVSPFAAVGFSGDLDSATKAFGAAAGYAWTPRVSFEGELNILPTSEASGVFEFDTHVWSLTGNALYHFAEQPFVPYGVVGIGFAHAGADTSDPRVPALPNIATSSNNFIVNFGGGIQRALTPVVSLRGDLRYFFGGDLVPDYWRLGAGVSFNLGQP